MDKLADNFQESKEELKAYNSFKSEINDSEKINLSMNELLEPKADNNNINRRGNSL